jgi:hypothetical protein
MLSSERLLCYDPGNTDLMANVGRAARAAGAVSVVAWINQLLHISRS